MTNPTLLFLDIECVGLELDAPIWDVAALRVDEYGDVEAELNTLVHHDEDLANQRLNDLPLPFQQDYLSRFTPDMAMHQASLMLSLQNLAYEAIVCGSNPSFDVQRLEKMADDLDAPKPNWHYHSEDIPTLARGWLNGKGVFPAPPWKSDFISQACGVSPKDFDRHTAMGDCQWCYALWKRVTSR